jgi:predicted NAD/FAD-binding protein
MVAAIWSCSVKQAGEFPLTFFLRFFLNHGLLDVKNRPQWYVLTGGSHSYIEPMIREFKDKIHINSPVTRIRRSPHGVDLQVGDSTQEFDQVIVACHSDQALSLLDRPTAAEQQILSRIPYQENDVVVHSDTEFMPVRKNAWASWNFLAAQPDSDQLPIVTYSMNILQGIGSIHDKDPLLVTLNANEMINEEKIICKFRYSHPVYSTESSHAQARRNEICGKDRVHYCGAYWYNGFHEDGVRSALDVCKRFGMTL